MGNAQTKAKWGAADAAIVVAMAAVVPAWSAWLNESQIDEPPAELVAAAEREAAERGPGSSSNPWATFVRYRPTKPMHLLKGFGTSFAYLAALDLLVARKGVDDNARFFVLHALANLAITIAATPDAYKSLLRPLHEPYGRMSILPVYLIATLFAYHLTAFKKVPTDEWVHHLLFGGGIGITGLLNPASQLGNALAFFICGLPGGLDYAMLAAVKEGLMRANTEKVVNTRLNVWCRAPGLTVVAYAMYIQMRHAPKPRAMSIPTATLVAALSVLNGQYYMQRVVGNTAVKVAPPAC